MSAQASTFEFQQDHLPMDYGCSLDTFDVPTPAEVVDEFTQLGSDAPYFREINRRDSKEIENKKLLQQYLTEAIGDFCESLLPRPYVYDAWDELTVQGSETDLDWRVEMPLSAAQIEEYTPGARRVVQQLIRQFDNPNEVPQVLQDCWLRVWMIELANKSSAEAIE